MALVSCSAPGRICLAGEDLDWAVGPSIVCSIDLRTRVTIQPNNSINKIKISTNYQNTSVEFPEEDLDNLKNAPTEFIVACLKFARKFGIKPTNIHIQVSSNIPIASGLSSSAAIILATLKALFTYYKKDMQNTTLCHYAYIVEHDILKRNVGQMDLYSCGLGGILYIDSSNCPPQKITRYNAINNPFIIIIDTLTARNTSDIIKLKKERFNKKEEFFIKYICACRAIVDKMKFILDSNQSISEIGGMAYQCQEILKKYLNVSTALIDACIDICKKNNVLGAKITGTGFGGCIFAIVDSLDTYCTLTKEMKDFPVKIHLSKIDYKGTIVEDKNNHWLNGAQAGWRLR